MKKKFAKDARIYAVIVKIMISHAYHFSLISRAFNFFSYIGIQLRKLIHCDWLSAGEIVANF